VNAISTEAFQNAIRATHGAGSRLVERVRVVEDFEDERVWEGEVLVFELVGHPSTSRCYAWEVGGEGDGGPRGAAGGRAEGGREGGDCGGGWEGKSCPF